MKLLVLAQIPPPLHGQSLMVQTLVEGLPARGIAVHHVNLGLSRDAADIGRWRPGKLFSVLGACARTMVARFRHGCDTLYYVPAPGKRGALYRDWMVMMLCRPFFRHLVLHWHAVGLGAWLADHATAPERWLTLLLLGRADLALVLAESLRSDAVAFAPRRIAVVANGISDPGPTPPRPRAAHAQFRVLFLGAVSEQKGAGVLLDAMLLLRQRGFAATVVFAGEAAEPVLRTRLIQSAGESPGGVELAGFVEGGAKAALLSGCDCVCLPTFYPHEGQPLVLLEAMAYDRPIIATHWRAIPDTLPAEAILIGPGEAEALANALAHLCKNPPAPGAFRRHFLAHFTRERHLAGLADCLTSLT